MIINFSKINGCFSNFAISSSKNTLLFILLNKYEKEFIYLKYGKIVNKRVLYYTCYLLGVDLSRWITTFFNTDGKS